MASSRSYLILLATLATAYVLSSTTLAPRTIAPGRWPMDDSVFDVPGWSVGTPTVELGDGIDNTAALVQRTYFDQSSDLQAGLVLWTNPQPEGKMLFRKGPDRDFLSAGYVIGSAPSELTPPPGGGALIAARGRAEWLLVYTYGERRGLLGDGPLAWFLAELDGLMDRPNDYFLARVQVPFDAAAAPPVAAASQLARVLFPRLAAWYGNA